MTDGRMAAIEWQAYLLQARDYPGTAEMLRELIAAYQEARKDSARLDWLQSRDGDTDVTFFCGVGICVEDGPTLAGARRYIARDYRSAIDAAMESEANRG
jgi:hypothetical protein